MQVSDERVYEFCLHLQILIIGSTSRDSLNSTLVANLGILNFSSEPSKSSSEYLIESCASNEASMSIVTIYKTICNCFIVII